MPLIHINHLNSYLDTLLVSTSDGLFIRQNASEIKLLDNLNINKTYLIDTSRYLIQAKYSLYLGNFTPQATFIVDEINEITSCRIAGDYVYYSTYDSENFLSIKKINLITRNKENIAIGNLPFEVVLDIIQENDNLFIVTQSKIIKFSLISRTITNQINLLKATCSLFLNNSIWIGNLQGELHQIDLDLNEIQTISVNGVPRNLINDTDLIITSTTGIQSLDLGSFTLTTESSTPCISYTNLLSTKILSTDTQIKEVLTNNLIKQYLFDRESLLNYSSGYYRSKPLIISTNNDTASFTWEQTGPDKNYQVGLTTTQSTDLINFSEYSQASTSNKGVFVPNITPLTQAVGFELFVNVSDQRLISPDIFTFSLNTNQKSNEEEPPFNLVKAETLITHTSYPQKFFDQSQVRRRHDNTFLKDILLEEDDTGIYDSVPYGFQYEFKSRVKDKFGRYSKESYNPLQINYTTKRFALTAAPIQNTNFTVLNPQEIFLDWDPVTKLIDGTPIPNGVKVLYRILRKDDSNSIYKTIYADDLLSLNADYVTSTDAINDDIKQLTDGITDITRDENDSALIFIEPVEITLSLDSAKPISYITLSFMKGFSPDKIDLQIIKGATESEVFTFDNLDFTLDEDALEEVTIRSINLAGDKVKITLTPNSSETLKIIQAEIFGIDNFESLTYYRDQDVNFKDGSQYYYIVQAILTDLVTPTEFQKEQRTIQLGPQATLGLTDATNGVLRIRLNSSGAIEEFITQEALPTKLQNLSSILNEDDIITLGGRLENSSFNLTSDLTYQTKIDGQILTEILGTEFGPFSVSLGDNDTFLVSADKKPFVTIVFTPGTSTASQIAFSINQAFNNDINYGEDYNQIAQVVGRQVKLEVPRLGLADRINIGTGNANELLGFTNKNLGIFRPRIDLRSKKAYHTSLLQDGYIFTFGGMFDYINRLSTNEILRSKISGEETNISIFETVDALPINLYGHNQAQKDEYVFIVGGITDNEQISDNCYLSSFDGIDNYTNWLPMASLIIPTALASSHVIGNYFYLIGGKQYNSSNNTKSATADIYRAEIDPNHRLINWQKIDELPKPIYLAASVAIDNKIYIIGGKNKNERLSKSIYVLEIDELTGNILDITTEDSLPFTIAGSTAIVKDNNIYVLGGEVNSGYTLGQQIDIIPPAF